MPRAVNLFTSFFRWVGGLSWMLVSHYCGLLSSSSFSWRTPQRRCAWWWESSCYRREALDNGYIEYYLGQSQQKKIIKVLLLFNKLQLVKNSSNFYLYLISCNKHFIMSPMYIYGVGGLVWPRTLHSEWLAPLYVWNKTQDSTCPHAVSGLRSLPRCCTVHSRMKLTWIHPMGCGITDAKHSWHFVTDTGYSTTP